MSYPVSLSIDVAWGDMDAYGHVNNTIFFRYFESVRVAYFRAIQELAEAKVNFASVVARATCDYLAPVVFPDKLLVQAKISKLGTSSFTMEYNLTSTAQKKLVAKGEAVIVCIDRNSGKAQPITQDIRKIIEQLEHSNST